MPLSKSSSPKAFTKNLKAEMHAGKPQKQAIAIAYSVKRKAAAQHKAKGGEMSPESKKRAMAAFAHKHGPECAHGCTYAAGGQVTDNYHEQDESGRSKIAHEEESGYHAMPEDGEKSNAPAESEDERFLNQHGKHEQGPQHPRMAEGGFITDNYADTEDGDGLDMVGRIMAMRQHTYSRGGQVANETHLDDQAGFSPNEFDDLALRDDLESSYTGANSGDELGDAQEDSDRRDAVKRIMAKRKAQTLPRTIPGNPRRG